MSHKFNENGFATGEMPKSGELEIKVIRANGEVEDYGVVSKYTPNPVKNWVTNKILRIKQLRRMNNGS